MSLSAADFAAFGGTTVVTRRTAFPSGYLRMGSPDVVALTATGGIDRVTR